MNQVKLFRFKNAEKIKRTMHVCNQSGAPDCQKAWWGQGYLVAKSAVSDWNTLCTL